MHESEDEEAKAAPEQKRRYAPVMPLVMNGRMKEGREGSLSVVRVGR